MKVSITTFPAIEKVYGHLNTNQTPGYITGINSVFRDPLKAGIYKKGWETFETGPQWQEPTPEDFKRLLIALQKTGVKTVHLHFVFPDGWEVSRDFEINDLTNWN